MCQSTIAARWAHTKRKTRSWIDVKCENERWIAHIANENGSSSLGHFYCVARQQYQLCGRRPSTIVCVFPVYSTFGILEKKKEKENWNNKWRIGVRHCEEASEERIKSTYSNRTHTRTHTNRDAHTCEHALTGDGEIASNVCAHIVVVALSALHGGGSGLEKWKCSHARRSRSWNLAGTQIHARASTQRSRAHQPMCTRECIEKY